MKHVPFDSVYRPNFEVVEQVEGRVHSFPHTAQLPLLHRALNLEFRGGLPSGIAKTNPKSDGFRKVLLGQAAIFFCNLVNGGRKDGVTILRLHDRDLLARVAVVQQITEESRLGKCHRFRFYAGEDFAPDIFLSGKELIFAEHVLERFKERVPHVEGEVLSVFLLLFMSGQCVAAPVNGGRALLMTYGAEGEFLAFPFKESDTEFFITTCLSMKEINDMAWELPTQPFNFHYDKEFKFPTVRNWNPPRRAKEAGDAWEKKLPITPIAKSVSEKNWFRMASFLKGITVKNGHGPGSQVRFLDDVPGPSVAEYKPDQKPYAWNEMEFYISTAPKLDWVKILAERDEFVRRNVPVFAGVGCLPGNDENAARA